MEIAITADELKNHGLDQVTALQLIDAIKQQLAEHHHPAQVWSYLSTHSLSAYPFSIHLLIFTSLFPDWTAHPENAPAWLPSATELRHSNLGKFMHEIGSKDVQTFHYWTTNHYQDFWQHMLRKLNIRFQKPYEQIVDLSLGATSPAWFPGAKLNIIDSCFTADPAKVAVIYADKHHHLCELTYGELDALSNRVANGLVDSGYLPGDAIAIAMPMTPFAVAIYLGIIKMGGVVISIADSFSSQEMAVRLKIGSAKAVFTQDLIEWGGKKLALYEKIKPITKVKAIVLPNDGLVSLPLRENDRTWDDFLVSSTTFKSVACDPMTPCNILFSSGTTAEPKAIPWSHSTPIKASSDAYLHQNVQAGDVITWPTNLGWMMGPWLIYAAFINHATLALFTDAPKNRAFGEFVQHANVTMLGVVPTLVASWRQSKCMEGLDWHHIKAFSSTGECSNAEDMLYLMSLGGYKPIIEYCGGTEIGGGYVTSTVLQNNYPSLFTTPAMGLDFIILNEEGKPSDLGEVALIPPSIGLSTTLLNADHDTLYFKNMPKRGDGKSLRRHGDQIRKYPNQTYAILGRVDDTMNLGGIKVSAAEIERVLSGIGDITELAAIAVTEGQTGPNQLVIFVATNKTMDKINLLKEMQTRINTHLNPLFKIHDISFISDLPKTASNKIMRRVLRKKYQELSSAR